MSKGSVVFCSFFFSALRFLCYKEEEKEIKWRGVCLKIDLTACFCSNNYSLCVVFYSFIFFSFHLLLPLFIWGFFLSPAADDKCVARLCWWVTWGTAASKSSGHALTAGHDD